MRLNLYLEFHTTTCNQGDVRPCCVHFRVLSMSSSTVNPWITWWLSRAKLALILTEIGWFSFLYWRHSSQILKLNHPVPHLQPSVNVLLVVRNAEELTL